MFLHNYSSVEKLTESISGLFATIIGIVSFLPVVYLIYKTKNTSNFPFKSLILALISNILWIYYAFVKVDYQVAFMGTLYFFIYIYILYTKLVYSK